VGVSLSKALGMARVSAKGSFNLFWGLAASTVISALSVIIIARLLSPAEYGIVSIAFLAPNLIVLFVDLGVKSAIVKYTAQFRAEEKQDQIRTIIKTGFLFQTIVASLFSLVCFLLADFLAVHAFLRPDMTFLIQISAITIFAGSLITSAQSVFTGYEKMHLYSTAITIQATVKATLGPALVVLGYGALGAVLGTTIAYVTAGVIGTVFFYQTIYKKTSNTPKTHQTNNKNTLKGMIKYGLPLSLSAIIVGFLIQFYNLMIARYATDAAVGNYNIAINFVVLITFFAIPITTMLFPAFSKLNPQTEHETLQQVFQYSVKYASFLVVPAAAIMISLSEPVIATVFGQQYTQAPLFLALYSVFYLSTLLGYLSITQLLNGLGKTALNLKLTLTQLAIGLPLALILVPIYGILGALITIIVAPLPLTVLGLWYLKKTYNLTIHYRSSAKILITSALSAAAAYLSTSQLTHLPSWTQLTIGTTIFVAVYLASTPLSGALSSADIGTLKQTLTALGPLSKPLNIPLTIMQKLVKQRQPTPPAPKHLTEPPNYRKLQE
jgi:stage V sporulation protein B